MKNLIFTLTLCLVCFMATAQTPFTMKASHVAYVETSAFSANSLNNPWVGAKLAYNVSGDVSQSFLLNARAMLELASGDRYAVPFLANVGLNNADSLNKDNGVSLGIFPWYKLSENGDLTLLLHGGLNYHILNRATVDAPNEFRILAGLEAALWGKNGGSPTTLSVAPEYVINTEDWTPGTATSGFYLNITGVVPIANGLGLLLEGTVPLNNTLRQNGLTIGVIVNSPID